MNQRLADNTAVLRAVAARIVGDNDADDIVQETFLRALSSPPSDIEAPLRPWLVTVARHVAIDWLRKVGRLELVAVDEAPDERETPADELPALLAGLGRLSQGEVVVLLLRDGLDLSIDEVAAAVGSSAGTVRVLHLRARRKAASADGPDVDGLVALDRFLTWLLARQVAGLPVRPTGLGPDAGDGAGSGPDPAYASGVLEAHGRLLDAMITVTHTAGRPDLEARARLSRGTVRAGTSPEAALDDLQRSIALGGDAALARRTMTWILIQRGRPQEARQTAEQALADTADPESRAHLHQLLAFLHHEAGDNEGARVHVEAARLRSRGPLASGLAFLMTERAEEARTELMVFLAGARERGSPPDEIVALINLGAASRDLDDEHEARHCFERALLLARRHGDRMREGTALGNLACVDRAEGRYAEAAVGFERAIGLARATGRPAYEELYRMNAAVLDHLRGRLERAETELRGVVERMTALGLGNDVRGARVWLTAVEAERGRADRATFAALRTTLEPGTSLVGAVEVLELLLEPEGARARLVHRHPRSAVRTAVALVAAALDRR